MKSGAATLAAACGLALAICGCRVRRPALDHARSQILYSASASDPRTFNPILVTDATSAAIAGYLFEGLDQLNELTTMPEPDLASSWDLSPDGKTVVFHLRHGLKWFDGQPLTARDVAFTMKVIYDPRVPNSYRSSLLIGGQPIKTEALDDYTVKMTLPRPFAPLLYSIGVPIIPEHILGPIYRAGHFNTAWDINTPPAKIVGDGQFELTRYVQSQLLDFKRNPDYWMSTPRMRLPRLHGRTVLIVSDQNAAYLRFIAGDTDVYSPQPEEVLDLKEKAAKLGIKLTDTGPDTGSLFFSFNRNPRHYIKHGIRSPKLRWFSDPYFLRAMAHLIDRQGMIDLCFHGLAVPAFSDISPANKVFYDPNLKRYDYDPARAEALLEAGGYHLVNGVRYDREGNRVEFDLTTNTDTKVRSEMCAIFKQDLENMGIKVNYRPVEFTTLVEELDSNFDWDCVLIGFTGTVDPNDGANFYRSSGDLHIWNPGQKTPATPWEAEIDRLMDEGSEVTDPKARAPYYWKIQELINQQLPIIVTVLQTRYDAYKSSLRDYQPTVWGLYRPEMIHFAPN